MRAPIDGQRIPPCLHHIGGLALRQGLANGVERVGHRRGLLSQRIVERAGVDVDIQFAQRAGDFLVGAIGRIDRILDQRVVSPAVIRRGLRIVMPGRDDENIALEVQARDGSRRDRRTGLCLRDPSRILQRVQRGDGAPPQDADLLQLPRDIGDSPAHELAQIVGPGFLEPTRSIGMDLGDGFLAILGRRQQIVGCGLPAARIGIPKSM